MFRLVLLIGLFVLPAHASDTIVVESGERQVAVVELYTSEGCSSCPPADRWLSRLEPGLRDEFEVLPLGFHVDYWNYLGWEDRFSSKAFTSRQRQLGANNQQRTIYTPEFFVNGMETRGADKILGEIQAVNQREAPLQLRLAVSRDGDSLICELGSPGDRNTAGPVHHRYLVYENNLATEVLRGENSGKSLRHQHVVRYMSPAISLQTENRHQIRLDPDWNPENIGVAVVVTSPGNMHYLQAIHTPVSDLLTRN